MKRRKWNINFAIWENIRFILWRLKYCDDDAKFPTILCKDLYLVKLIVKFSHEKDEHNGVREILNLIRQEFWIPKARNFIRKII